MINRLGGDGGRLTEYPLDRVRIAIESPHGTAYIPAEHIPLDPRIATGEFFLGEKNGTWEGLGSLLP